METETDHNMKRGSGRGRCRTPHGASCCTPGGSAAAGE